MQLPRTPFDGQEFIDAYRVKWIYNLEDNNWSIIGVANDIPIARGLSHQNGPTNGLLSAKQKGIIDNLDRKPGGFGFIVKPGLWLTEENGINNVLSGDISLTSNSIKFTCGQDDNDPLLPSIKFGLSDNFIDSFCVQIPGIKGPKGEKGDPGREGRHGTGDGPKGDAGDPGDDATVRHVFTGIKYEDLEEVWDTAIVDINLDEDAGILETIKAKVNVPTNDKPASKITALPAIRNITFNTDDFSDWQLEAGPSDVASEIDLNIIKLPKGWQPSVVGDTDPVPINTIKLSTLTQSIVNLYDEKANECITQWCKELKTWAYDLDKQARDNLHELAKELAECQFELPLEFCLGIEQADCAGLIKTLEDISENVSSIGGGVGNISENINELTEYIVGPFDQHLAAIEACVCSDGDEEGNDQLKTLGLSLNNFDILNLSEEKVGKLMAADLSDKFPNSKTAGLLAHKLSEATTINNVKEIVESVTHPSPPRIIELCPGFSFNSKNSKDSKNNFSILFDITSVLNCETPEYITDSELYGILQFIYDGNDVNYRIKSNDGNIIYNSDTAGNKATDDLIRVYDTDNPIKLMVTPKSDNLNYEFKLYCTGMCE